MICNCSNKTNLRIKCGIAANVNIVSVSKKCTHLKHIVTVHLPIKNHTSPTPVLKKNKAKLVTAVAADYKMQHILTGYLHYHIILLCLSHQKSMEIS